MVKLINLLIFRLSFDDPLSKSFQVSSAKERKTQSDECAKLTQHFLSTLPKLLSKVSVFVLIITTLD